MLPLVAQTPVQQRVAELPAILSGTRDPAATFAPAFLAQIPPAKYEAVEASLAAEARFAALMARTVELAATR